ncbi:hypothetical protein [Laceyella putida]|uniref:Uncharacterized protein n=1 Tax=Laceyella putida TaxID=110101 RepID=A0ABW2RKP9_9BACL
MNYWRKERGGAGSMLLWLVVIGILVYLLAPSIRRLLAKSQEQGMVVTMSNLAAQTKEQMGQYIDLTKFLKRKPKAQNGKPTENRGQTDDKNIPLTPGMGDMGNLMDENLFGSQPERPKREHE